MENTLPRFLAFEPFSSTECKVVLRQAAKGGAYDLDEWIIPIDKLSETPERIVGFLSLIKAGII